MRRRDMLAASAALIALNGSVANAVTEGPITRPDAAREDAAFARWHTANRRFAATASGDIAYVERGAGPAALFLHGFPLNSFQWRDALSRLSPHRRCVAPDFMGLGATRVAPGQSVAPAAQAAMLAALLDKLSIDTVDLVANDSGGSVAQLFLVRYPDRVRSLLLTNCDAEPDSPPPVLLPVIEMARNGTFADRFLARWLADKTLARATGLGGDTYSDPTQPTDTAIEQYLGPLVATPASKALAHAYILGLTPNPLAGAEARLRVCEVPVRIVWGLKDPIFSQASPGYFDGLFPNSRGVRQVPGGKLFFPEEYPEILAEEARRLWGVG